MTRAGLERALKREQAARKREAAARKRAEEAQRNAEAERQALQARLDESLDQSAATNDILRVIASSPTGLQPVFDAIADSALRVCGAWSTAVWRVENSTIRAVAASGGAAGSRHQILSFPPRPITNPDWTRTLQGHVLEIHDVETEGNDATRALARSRGWRSVVYVPMRPAIGVITATRREPGSFSVAQIGVLKTFADQAVIAIENVRLFTELQSRNRELRTALDQQTATADILRIISRSRTDVQPVFEAILTSAVRLLRASSGALTRIAGDQLELAALTSTDGAGDAALKAFYPRPLDSEGPHPQTIRDRAPLNIADAHTDPRLPEAVRNNAPVRGFRSMVAVPLLRHDEAVGTIGVSRREPGGFSEDEVALLQSFADQAVIAIENVRLFTELQDKHREVTEALERQTATSEILRAISTSPADARPVFDAIVHNARRLVNGTSAAVQIFRDGQVHLAAMTSTSPEGDAAVRAFFPFALATSRIPARLIATRQPHVVADVDTDPLVTPRSRELARARGVRSQIFVPMLRGEDVIGLIAVSRADVGRFTDEAIALLQTFADQAVIAIENVRLFTELQARNRELTESLDRQTASAEILRAISQSQTDVQPVFEAIVRNAVRLCGARQGGLYRFDGELVHSVVHVGYTPEQLEAWRRTFPRPLTGPGRAVEAIRTRSVVRVDDAVREAPPDASAEVLAIVANIRARDLRSVLAVPMLHKNEVIGAISLGHVEAAAFTDAHVELLQTFADQAVIAIENARLLTELQARTTELTRSVDELTALGDVSRALASTLDLETVLQTIVTRATQLAGTAGCTIWEYDAVREEFRLRASHNADPADSVVVGGPDRVTSIPKGSGVTSRVIESRQPVQIADITAEGAYESPIRRALIDAGHRALLGVPLLSEDEAIGVLAVTRKTPGEFAPEIVDLLTTFATQSALAIGNARLFHELEVKSRELEVASQHKSEFLASMSHELRTPLNAIIGFSDVLLERMFGDVNEKQEEYLRDILASGKHLLSLINDILDLSKIEAGRMELDLAEFDLPMAVDNALTLMRERAGRRGLALEHIVDERLGEIRADERKIKQVLLNLLSNAVKFTPEGGRVTVRAVPVDGGFEISVTDTGIGIAPDDHEAVFEEFRQVGRSDKKAEGTGLGLALCRKFVELHGGRIWLKSEVGHGSTFTFTIPAR